MALTSIRKLYNPTVSLRRIHFFALAVLVATVVALYPYLGDMGMCDPGECPYAARSSSHTSPSGPASVCVGAVLSALPALLAFATLRGRRLSDERSRPAQFFLSPDPPPPQPS